MKVCFVSYYCNSGFKSFLNNYINFLTSNKHEVSVIYLGEESTGNPNLINETFIDVNSKKHHLSFKDWCFVNSFPCRKFYKLASLLIPVKLSAKKLEYKILKHQCFIAKQVIKSGVKLDLSGFDVVISAEELMCNYFLANNVTAKRKIAFIHPDYKLAHFNAKIDKHFLKNVDLICSVSKSGANSIKEKLKGFDNKVMGVPNYINVDEIIKKSSASLEGEAFDKKLVNLVTVCRLDNSSKALDRLLAVASSLKKENPNFIWRIVGEGYYREDMEKIIKDNNLENHVILLGHKDNPFPYIKASDLFVLQSYYEGYPISACEALICDTPILLTNFPSAYEIISNEFDGVIVENNYDAIYEKIKTLVSNKALLESYKKELSKSDKKRFLNGNAFLEVLKMS